MKWETLLINGDFIDPGGDSPGFIALDGGKIAHTGPAREAGSAKSQAKNVVDLSGMTVIPGFTDTHNHFLLTGLNLSLPGLFFCRSVEDIQDILRHTGPKLGGWMVGLGFDESMFQSMAFPVAADLDRVSKKLPICIFRRDHHSCVINSRAMEILEMAPVNDEEKSGIIKGETVSEVHAAVFASVTKTEKLEAFQRAARAALSFGITCVHALEGGGPFGDDDIRIAVEASGSAPLSMIVYPQTRNVEWVKYELGLPRIGGCLLADGSIGSRTAALFEDYADDPGNKGRLYFKDEELESLVEKAHKEGLQTAFHAIGDRAVAQVVSVYKKVLGRLPGEDRRYRVEHAVLSRPEDIEEMASLGIHVSVQPEFAHLWGGEGGLYEARLGKDRSRRSNPFGTYLEKGITLGAGSDSDVCTMDVMSGISSAVNRAYAEESISIMDTIKLYTSEAAKLAFMERETGRLLPGMRADIVVLSENPLSSPRIEEIEVVGVFAGGDLKFGRMPG
ncbi:MAG: amidohydrolase [Chloroflexi bacterium]|nr:amidohydrolase [Chloroflexota bacterium]